MKKAIENYVPVAGVLIHFDQLITAFVRGANSVDVEILTEEHVRLVKLAAETIERRIKELHKGDELCPTK